LAIIFVEILTALTDERAQVKRYITAACIFVVIVFGVLVNSSAARFENKYVFWANAVSENPKSVIVRGALGMRFVELGKYEQAETEFFKAIQLDPYSPKNVMSYTNLGVIYMRTDRLEQAEQCFLAALELSDYEDDLLYYNMASLYLLLKNYTAAIEYINKALEIAPENEKYKNLKSDIMQN
jgi:tetratricopeptide (TPR) repeat protein